MAEYCTSPARLTAATGLLGQACSYARHPDGQHRASVCRNQAPRSPGHACAEQVQSAAPAVLTAQVPVALEGALGCGRPVAHLVPAPPQLFGRSVRQRQFLRLLRPARPALWRFSGSAGPQQAQLVRASRSGRCTVMLAQQAALSKLPTDMVQLGSDMLHTDRMCYVQPLPDSASAGPAGDHSRLQGPNLDTA